MLLFISMLVVQLPFQLTTISPFITFLPSATTSLTLRFPLTAAKHVNVTQIKIWSADKQQSTGKREIIRWWYDDAWIQIQKAIIKWVNFFELILIYCKAINQIHMYVCKHIWVYEYICVSACVQSCWKSRSDL